MGKLTVVNDGIKEIKWSQKEDERALDSSFSLVRCTGCENTYNFIVNGGTVNVTLNSEGLVGLYLALNKLINSNVNILYALDLYKDV